MTPRRYSKDDLYDFAAQILLKEKTWEDFDFLNEHDQKQVEAIISRGKSALSQQRSKQEKHVSVNMQSRHKVLGTNYDDKSYKKKIKEKKHRIGLTKLTQTTNRNQNVGID